MGTHDSDASRANQHAAETTESSQDDSMFSLFLNSECRKAIDDAQYFEGWNDTFNKGAKTACKMFHKYLKDNQMNYDAIRFVTHPAMPYFFMTAHLQRELNALRVVDIEHGVIERSNDKALETFAKHIHITDTKDSAMHLAQMIHCFHAGPPMALVEEHMDKSWRAELNEPVLNKLDDGSISLIYDLIHTGRSTKVEQCILNVTPEYHATLTCTDKPKS